MRLKLTNVQLRFLKKRIQKLSHAKDSFSPDVQRNSQSPAVIKVRTAAVVTHLDFQVRIHGDSHLISNQGKNLPGAHFRGQLLT